jgi:hypothetical protein
MNGSETTCAIRDSRDPTRWITMEGGKYELTVAAVQLQPDWRPAVEMRSLRFVLVGVPVPERVVASDMRPMAKRIIDHGKFTRKDWWTDYFLWSTPVDKYILDLGESASEEGIRHRFHLSELPTPVLQVCFGIQSKVQAVLTETSWLRKLRLVSGPDDMPNQSVPSIEDELFQQTGIIRIHIHLESTTGVVLISEEFATRVEDRTETRRTFGGKAGPSIGKGFNALVAASSHEMDNEWRFEPNSARGASFVGVKGMEYHLEITIVEVDEGDHPKKVLRPMIKS